MTRRQTAGIVRHRSAESRRDRQRAPPGMTPDPPDREFRSIQVEHAGSAECILRRSMRGVFGRAAPCTCRSEATAKADYPWDGGMGPVAGDAVDPPLGAWPRHPCRGHPRNRTHPAFDRFPRSVDPRHAWMNLCRISKSIGRQIRFPKENGSDATTPCRSRINPTVTGKLSKVGRCRIAGCPRHGCRGQAPMDGFTASPQSDTAPPNPQKTRAVLALALALASSRCRAQPCRPTLPCARKRFHCFQQTVIPSPRQYHIAEQHAPTGDPC